MRTEGLPWVLRLLGSDSMLWKDISCTLLLGAMYFSSGDVFLHLVFFNNLKGRRGLASRILFCSTLTLNFFMFQLIIFDIMDWLSTDYRLLQWKLMLPIAVMGLLVVLPFCQFYFICTDYRLRWWKSLIISLIGLGMYLLLMWKIGERLPLMKGEVPRIASGGQFIHSLLFNSIDTVLTEAVCRVGLVGVAMMALLSGFGAVNNPLGKYIIRKFTKERNVGEIGDVEFHQQQVLESLINKKKRYAVALSEARKQKLTSNYTPKGISRIIDLIGLSWIRGLLGTDPWLERETMQLLSTLNTEIAILERISARAFVELNDMYTSLQDVEFERTIKGKFHYALGRFFSVYCVYKFFMTSINVLLDRVSKKDPVSFGIELFLHYLNVQFDVALVLQQVSFLLVFIIIMTSVRGFLLSLQKVTDLWFSNVSPSSIVVVFAQIMGMYFTSSVLLLRSNLPSKYRGVWTQVLGQDIQYNFYHRWFDIFFLCAMIITMIALIIIERAKNIGAEKESDEREKALWRSRS